MIDFNKSLTKKRMPAFVQLLQDIQDQTGFKISKRGWGYALEGQGYITKDQFDKVSDWIDSCVSAGLLPVDFVAHDGARVLHGIEDPEQYSPTEYFGAQLAKALKCGDWYTPDWFDGEACYIQVLVEKVDLVSLFSPICEAYHVPIANARGWSSRLQRAIVGRRFKIAEQSKLQPVLLYCGDFDPAGLRISDFMYKNLADVKDVVWADGQPGYDPDSLIIDRFGLNFGFIEQHGLSWINNLLPANPKKDKQGNKIGLDHPEHADRFKPYVQDYLAQYGARKCEANALVAQPTQGQALIEQTIQGYLGQDVKARFDDKRQAVQAEIKEFQDETGLGQALLDGIDQAGLELT